MLPKETVNKYETPLNKKHLIPKNNSIQNSKNFQIFCKDLTKINIPNECGWTPLYRTVIAGDISSTNFLLNNGADPNVKCTMGETPLFQAVDMEKIDHVKILLKNGANPNITNDDGLTPLHNAVTKKNILIVKILLKYGADPNIKSKFYLQTPLHLAIKNNADPMILLLLVQFNGSLMDEDKFNKKPIDYTNSKEMKSIIEKLKFGKENSNIIIEKEILNFQTPKKMTKWTPSNVYSNTIYSQSYGKNLTIEGSNAVLQNPGSVKINIINNNNNIKNNSIKGVKKDLFNSNDKNYRLRDIHNKINDYKEESINEININSTKTKKDTNKNNINIKDKENISSNANLIISSNKTKTGKFSSTQENNILNENSKDKIMNFNLKLKNINENSFANESRNKINFSFSTNDFNNKIKNNYSQKIENEDKENNFKTANLNINEKNQNKINDSNIKISFKERKNNLNSSIKSVTVRDKINDKYLYENIIKKSITKIEIFEENNKLNESISKTIKSDLNEEDSKTKFANEFLCNKPILSNNLTFTKNMKIINMKPSYMIYLNKSSSRIDKKIPKRNSLVSKVKYNFNKNLSFHKKRITADQININNNFKKNVKARNEKVNPLSRVSLTTLGTSGNELNSNKSSLWEILNEVISNEKSLYQSFLSNNSNSEFNCDYDYEYEQNYINYKYPIYDWLKEIKLHCYYNLFKEKNILSMNNIISNLKTGKYNITKADIGRIGIIIPGHIYRIITKLEIDSNKIKEKITKIIIKTKNGISSKDINITKNSVNFCYGCCALNEEIYNYNNLKKIFNLEQWLNEINMIKYKENFIENGFDFFEYFILQMFSTIPIDDYILKKELKIEEEKDRDIILLKLNSDIKYLIQKTNKALNDINNFYDDKNEINNENDKQKNKEDSDCIII